MNTVSLMTNKAEGDLGIRSNFGSVARTLGTESVESDGEGGGGSTRRSAWSMREDQEELEIKRANTVRRHREIRRRLRRIPVGHQSVLEAYWTDRRWSQLVRTAWGRVAGVAIHAPTARDYFRDDTGRKHVREATIVVWLEGLIARAANGDGDAVEIAHEIKLEAELMYGAAMHAFDPRGTEGAGKVEMERKR